MRKLVIEGASDDRGRWNSRNKDIYYSWASSKSGLKWNKLSNKPPGVSEEDKMELVNE
jgi:hypothetical protein